MTMTELLFSFRGRISRQPWWLATLLTFVVLVLVVLIGLRISGSVESTMAVVLVFYLPITWIGFALGAKRLHDRNRSAWWLLLFYVVPGLLHGFGQQFGGAMDFGRAPLASEGGAQPPLVLNLVIFALTIWGLVEMGFLKGTPGPNRYGADPLAPNA